MDGQGAAVVTCGGWVDGIGAVCMLSLCECGEGSNVSETQTKKTSLLQVST